MGCIDCNGSLLLIALVASIPAAAYRLAAALPAAATATMDWATFAGVSWLDEDDEEEEEDDDDDDDEVDETDEEPRLLATG